MKKKKANYKTNIQNRGHHVQHEKPKTNIILWCPDSKMIINSTLGETTAKKRKEDKYQNEGSGKSQISTKKGK